MVFNNVELHNVDYVEKGEHGHVMYRVSKDTRDKLNPRARDVSSHHTTGVEIRFCMNCDKAVLKLFVNGENRNRFLPCQLFYGGIHSGWVWYNPINLNDGLNEIVIDNVKLEEKVAEKSKKEGHTFDYSVIRVLLGSADVEFVGLEGDVRPPLDSEKPQKKILFYGSSITHGSLGCMPSLSFVNIIAGHFKVDVFNKGFPGTCHCSNAMADYIAARNDFDFAVCEVATNIYGAIPDEELTERIKYLINVYREKTGKKLIIIDNLILNDKKEDCRALVKKAVEAAGYEGAIYVNGRCLLESESNVTADMTHPNPMGQIKIAENLIKIIQQNSLI